MEQSVKMVFRYAFVLFIKRNLILKTHDTKMEGKRMENVKKYQRQYHMPPEKCTKWAQKEYVEKAPSWCSVDLRDGNQALVIPMSLEQKIEFFKLLVKIGFKEIEVGFPAASETEYTFLRTLIEQNLIPEDVTIQVLTQAREHIIRKTFEAVKGAPKAIIHVYNSTSVAQREQVFKKSKEEIIRIAVEGAQLLKELAEETEGNFQFEYSPESFTGTEPEYALEVCNAVLDVWKPTAENKCIINLPVTVQLSMPHVYASQIEYMSTHMKYREHVILSQHPHNDRGCGVADAEMGLLAGADRVEGTLFGNGERTGNVDIVTLAMNMYSQGVDPGLDFSDMPGICEVYEKCTGMKVDERSPYSGALVFAAGCGSGDFLFRIFQRYGRGHERGEKSGAVTIVITNFRDSLITKYADLVICTSQQQLFYGDAIFSRTAQMMIVDMIYMGLIVSDYDRFCTVLDKSSRGVRDKAYSSL